MQTATKGMGVMGFYKAEQISDSNSTHPSNNKLGSQRQQKIKIDKVGNVCIV